MDDYNDSSKRQVLAFRVTVVVRCTMQALHLCPICAQIFYLPLNISPTLTLALKKKVYLWHFNKTE